MTQKRLLIPLIAVLFAVGIQQAYGDEQTVDVPFAPDASGCYYTYNDELNLFIYRCTWSMVPTDEEIIIIAESNPEMVPEALVDAIIAESIVEVEVAKPQTPAEKEIKKLYKKWQKDGELPSHEAQLLRALESYQKECEIGTEQGAPIQTYELFYIATYEPYTHTDLGTQYLLDKIERAIQICKAQTILKEKVLGDQYLHIPSTNEPKIIWTTNATLPEDAQAKYDEAKMYDFFAQQSIQFAEQFQCSIEGKQQGHCPSAIGDTPIPKPTISNEGKAMLTKYKAFLETGITELPFQEPDEPFVPTIALDQYIDAYGISEEALKEWYESRNP